MRLCANENIGADTVARLRDAGHDVLWIREAAAGASDAEVLSRSQNEMRLLLTFDKDFGELACRHTPAVTTGIVLFRISQTSAGAVAGRICAILGSRNDWEGHYSVVDDANVRMRPLPMHRPTQ